MADDAALDRATAMERRADGGGFAADIDPGWFVQNGPNGGYVAALLLRALIETVDDATKPPRSLTVHFLQPAVAGPAELDVEVLRAGRSLTFLAVRLRQGDRLVANGAAAFGVGRSDLEFQDVLPPEVPSPDALPVPETGGATMPPIAHQFDYRPITDATLFGGGQSDYWSWLRLSDGRGIDALALAAYVDALVPAMFLRVSTPMLFPTVDITVHFRRAPQTADPWCLGHVRTTAAADGFTEEDCELYDSTGALLAQSRQLAIAVPL